MSNARALIATLLVFSQVACAGAEDPTPGADGAASQTLVRTGDPYQRGYTDDDFPRVRRLANGVYSYEQLRSAGEERFTTVSLFVVTSEGVLVADGQGSLEESRLLVETIAGITDQPITHVVICSDHGDHTAGNAAFPEDAEYLAHPTSANLLQASADRADRDGGTAVRRPTQLVPDQVVLRLGETEIQVLHLGRAHTGGDLVVYLPADGILFMSEAYLHRIFPAMRSAYPTEWVAMIEAAQSMEVDVFVPGHGFVDSPEVLREELETFRRALQTVIDEGRRLHAEGVPAEEAGSLARFGDLENWSLRESQGTRAIQRVYLELEQGLPPRPSGE